MRKEYNKPLLYAETFALAEHISAGCAYMANFGNDCQLTVDGLNFFTESAGCADGDGMILLRGVMSPDEEEPTLQDFYKLNMKCYNSFVDFTTGDLFTS